MFSAVLFVGENYKKKIDAAKMPLQGMLEHLLDGFLLRLVPKKILLNLQRRICLL